MWNWEVDWKIHTVRVESDQIVWDLSENEVITEGRAHYSECFRQSWKELEELGPPTVVLEEAPWKALGEALDGLQRRFTALSWMDSLELQRLARVGDVSGLLGRLQQGCSPDRVLGQRDALYWAVTRAHQPAALLLLSRGATLHRTYPTLTGGHRALIHWASLQGMDEVLRVLLREGAEVDATTETGETALMLLARDQTWRPDTAEILLAAGADPNRLCRPHQPLVRAPLQEGWNALLATSLAPNQKKQRAEFLLLRGARKEGLSEAQRGMLDR